ncbi:MAG: thiolase family protein, partial [Rhodobacteraceae bacterium]|nr:thiolase family protein [Paracoccaceae bacterium]
YAVQAIACQRHAGLDPTTMNRGGGALARGHPIGASGAINAARLFHEMQTTGGKGIAAIAAAGGLGTALLLDG